MLVKNKRSFTLVEILLALAILGVGLVGILSVFVAGANSVRRAVEKTEACFIAQMVFEDFKRQGHIDPSSLTVPSSEISQYYSGYTVPTPTPTAVGSISNLYRIDLGVQKGGRTIENFTTYITKYEP